MLYSSLHRHQSCPFALRLEGTERCWDPQLCCLQCPTCPRLGKLRPGAAQPLPRVGAAPGVPRAAAGFAPGKHVHFGSLACPPAPGASPRSSPFLCNRPDTPHIPLCRTVRARQPLCPSCALGAFCRVERGKGRARQPQLPQGHSVAVLAVLPVGLGSLQRAQGGGGCPGPEAGGAGSVECPPLL